MKSIKIEVYRESYLEEINNLILKDTNYIQKIENSQHVLLLLGNETLIGVGSISNNFMHPYRKYISVYIDPGKRNNGLGMLLFNELNMRYYLNELQTALDSDNINLGVLFSNETVWLNQSQMVELFQRDRSVISRHIKNILEEGELEEESTIAKYAIVQDEGNRAVERETSYYNLDMIIAAVYRV